MADSLADDEAKLAEYANQLIAAVWQVSADWIRSSILQVAPSLVGSEEVDRAAEAAAAAIDRELRELLRRDIDEQASGPLEVLRRNVRFATDVLDGAGATPVARDSFAHQNFPDDTYNLSPASFAAVHPSLHEPGLMWGAAKAHVHLRRRRDQDVPVNAEVAQRVVVLSVDLMDRSKIEAAYPDAVFVRSPAALTQQAVGADLVLVDLARLNDPGAIMSIESRVVAFGSHVDEAALEAAADAGAEALARSVFFRRLEDRAL